MSACVVYARPGVPVRGYRDGRVPVPVLCSAQAPRPESTWDPPEPVLGEDALPQHWGDPPLGGTGSARSPLPGHRCHRVPQRHPPLLSRRRARPCGSCCSGCGRCRASGSRLTGSSKSEYRYRDGRDTRHLPPGKRIPHPVYFASCWDGAVGVADELQLAAGLCAGHLNPILTSSR